MMKVATDIRCACGANFDEETDPENGHRYAAICPDCGRREIWEHHTTTPVGAIMCGRRLPTAADLAVVTEFGEFLRAASTSEKTGDTDPK